MLCSLAIRLCDRGLFFSVNSRWTTQAPSCRDIIYYVRTFRRNVFYWRYLRHPTDLLTNSVRRPFAFRYAAFCSAKCDLSQRKRPLIVRPWQSTHCTSCPDALVRCQPRPVPRLKEAYSVGFVHKNVLYRTCGHNKLCPYSGCLKCLQVNKSYAELTFN